MYLNNSILLRIFKLLFNRFSFHHYNTVPRVHRHFKLSHFLFASFFFNISPLNFLCLFVVWFGVCVCCSVDVYVVCAFVCICGEYFILDKIQIYFWMLRNIFTSHTHKHPKHIQFKYILEIYWLENFCWIKNIKIQILNQRYTYIYIHLELELSKYIKHTVRLKMGIGSV